MASMHKVALISGVTGQDGYYLSRFLLEKGYEVHGVRRRVSTINYRLTDDLMNLSQNSEGKFKLHYGDLTDPISIQNIIEEVEPNEIYNLAAQSHVDVSFENPFYTGQVNAMGIVTILEFLRTHKNLNIKLYQASTSELFGSNPSKVLTEESRFEPISPYSISKLYAYKMVEHYRNTYEIFAVNGILFNHESKLRGETFVTRKITRGLARIHVGIDKQIVLGNLNSIRDWGHAEDYVEAMWLMLQHKTPTDFVIATGTSHSIREFVNRAASQIGIEIRWEGSGLNEVGINPKTDELIIRVSEEYYRASEVVHLQGDAGKAKKLLNWVPKHNLDSLIKEMVQNDLLLASMQKSYSNQKAAE
jgi:GDPmannose 4,6-dehydratase